MDTTFPGNAGHVPGNKDTPFHKAFYASIIGWETLLSMRSAPGPKAIESKTPPNGRRQRALPPSASPWGWFSGTCRIP